MKLNLLTMKEGVYFSQKEVKVKHLNNFFLEKSWKNINSLCALSVLTTLTISIHVNLFAQMM